MQRTQPTSTRMCAVAACSPDQKRAVVKRHKRCGVHRLEGGGRNRLTLELCKRLHEVLFNCLCERLGIRVLRCRARTTRTPKRFRKSRTEKSTKAYSVSCPGCEMEGGLAAERSRSLRIVFLVPLIAILGLQSVELLALLVVGVPRGVLQGTSASAGCPRVSSLELREGIAGSPDHGTVRLADQIAGRLTPSISEAVNMGQPLCGSFVLAKCPRGELRARGQQMMPTSRPSRTARKVVPVSSDPRFTRGRAAGILHILHAPNRARVSFCLHARGHPTGSFKLKAGETAGWESKAGARKGDGAPSG